MASAPESNKAKIAKRVIEVLEFFDEENREATVMDIVRRYGRPQSSTSELLSSMVDLGLLYKDPCSRSYILTPRAAMLGSHFQPPVVRDGRLTTLLDRLVQQTGLSVAIFGMVGMNAQIFTWRNGTKKLRTSERRGFCGGLLESLTDTAPGILLLSTVAQPRRDGLVRRLNAEASDDKKFSFSEMSAQIDAVRRSGFVSGAAGYGSIADISAVLLPGQPESRPMAVGFVYEPSDQIDCNILMQCLQDAVARCIEPEHQQSASVLAIAT